MLVTYIYFKIIINLLTFLLDTNHLISLIRRFFDKATYQILTASLLHLTASLTASLTANFSVNNEQKEAEKLKNQYFLAQKIADGIKNIIK